MEISLFLTFNPLICRKVSFDRCCCYCFLIKIPSKTFNSLFHRNSKVSERGPMGQGAKTHTITKSTRCQNSPTPFLEVDFLTKSISSQYFGDTTWELRQALAKSDAWTLSPSFRLRCGERLMYTWEATQGPCLELLQNSAWSHRQWEK